MLVAKQLTVAIDLHWTFFKIFSFMLLCKFKPSKVLKNYENKRKSFNIKFVPSAGESCGEEGRLSAVSHDTQQWQETSAS